MRGHLSHYVTLKAVYLWVQCGNCTCNLISQRRGVCKCSKDAMLGVYNLVLPEGLHIARALLGPGEGSPWLGQQQHKSCCTCN